MASGPDRGVVDGELQGVRHRQFLHRRQLHLSHAGQRQSHLTISALASAPGGSPRRGWPERGCRGMKRPSAGQPLTSSRGTLGVADPGKRQRPDATCAAARQRLSMHEQARRQSRRSVQEGARRGDPRDGGRARADGRLFGRSARLRRGRDAAAAGDAAADPRRGDAGARHRRRLRAAAALSRRRHPPPLRARGRDGRGALRGDGDGALRGGGRAGDAGHRREHRRADRRGGAAAWATARSPTRRRRRWRRRRATWCATSPPGGALPKGRAERHGALARASRGAGRRHLRGARRRCSTTSRPSPASPAR